MPALVEGDWNVLGMLLMRPLQSVVTPRRPCRSANFRQIYIKRVKVTDKRIGYTKDRFRVYMVDWKRAGSSRHGDYFGPAQNNRDGRGDLEKRIKNALRR